MKQFTFSVPQEIIVEKGGICKLPEVAKRLGGKKAFIISGPHYIINRNICGEKARFVKCTKKCG